MKKITLTILASLFLLTACNNGSAVGGSAPATATPSIIGTWVSVDDDETVTLTINSTTFTKASVDVNSQVHKRGNFSADESVYILAGSENSVDGTLWNTNFMTDTERGTYTLTSTSLTTVVTSSANNGVSTTFTRQ